MNMKDYDQPTESLLLKLNVKLGKEFDKVVTDARVIRNTEQKLEQAEENQDEIDDLASQIIELGAEILEGISEFKTKIQT